MLTPGLKVHVDGRSDDRSRVVAKTITFDGDDLEIAHSVGNAQTIHESEMALFYEWMQKCAQKRGLTVPTLLERDVSSVTVSKGHFTG